MRLSLVGLYAFFLAATTVVAGCGGEAGIPPPAGTPPGDSIRRDGRPWMDAKFKKQTLLYVSNTNGVVNVYEYWTHKLVGVLTKFTQPAGACTDKAGDVYIVDYQGQKVSEYAHGGKKPIDVISDSYYPYACSVDRTTGDLAVANYRQPYYPLTKLGYKPGNLAIYKAAKGKPTYYGNGDDFFACAYDDRGDLLASTFTRYSSQEYSNFYYLPKNGKTLLSIDLPGPSTRSYWDWGFVDGVAYDGKYWIVDAYKLYRYRINIKAEYVDSIGLTGGSGNGGIAVYRNPLTARATQVVGPIGYDSETTAVGYWKYPAGGDAYYEITSGLDKPDGVAISLRQEP